MVSPMPDHIPTMETYREKATRKFKENPLVPLGSLATVGALVTAMVKMRRGQSKSFNNWLRVRVAAQGLTVVAIVLGTYRLGARKEEGSLQKQSELDTQKAREEKAEKERMAFENRLKEAEISHEIEAAWKNRRAASESTTSPSTDGESNAAAASSSSSSGWFSRRK